MEQYNYGQQNNQQENSVNNANDYISVEDSNILAKFKELYNMILQRFKGNYRQLRALKEENNKLKEELIELREENKDLCKDIDYFNKQIAQKESVPQPYDIMKLVLPDLTRIKAAVTNAQSLESLKANILELYQGLFSSFEAAGIILSESENGARLNPGDRVTISCDVPTNDITLDGKVCSSERFGCFIQGDKRVLEERVKIYRYEQRSQTKTVENSLNNIEANISKALESLSKINDSQKNSDNSIFSDKLTQSDTEPAEDILESNKDTKLNTY